MASTQPEMEVPSAAANSAMVAVGARYSIGSRCLLVLADQTTYSSSRYSGRKS